MAEAPSFTVEVPVTVVPKMVELTDGTVYLFREGRLWSCGSLDCILGHLNDQQLPYAESSIRDHFNGGYAGHGSPCGPLHVVQVDGGWLDDPDDSPNERLIAAADRLADLDVDPAPPNS